MRTDRAQQWYVCEQAREEYERAQRDFERARDHFERARRSYDQSCQGVSLRTLQDFLAA